MRFDLTPFVSLQAAQEWARDEIEGAAAAARARFITLSPGQEAAYQVKYDEAVAFLGGAAAGPDSAFPWIAAEAQRSGMPLAAVAVRIKRRGDQWRQVVGPRIEAVRVTARDQLSNLSEISQVVKAVRITAQALREIKEEGG